MGKAHRRKHREERLFRVEGAPRLGKEPTLDKQGNELCIQCGHGTVAVLRDKNTGQTLMRTSPFRVVDTPHGRRVIHDACLWHIQHGEKGDLTDPCEKMRTGGG